MNVFNLMAKFTLDKSDYEKGLNEVKHESTKSLKSMKNEVSEYIDELKESLRIERQLYAEGKISVDEYKSDIKAITNNLRETKAELGDVNKTLTSNISSSVTAFSLLATAITIVTKKTLDLALATAEYGKQLSDLSNKWGFSTKEIQEFDYWATQNGTTLNNLLLGMKNLVNQAQADNKAFETLGVAVRDNTGNLKDQKTLFLETITALQKMENQTERNALQFDIFGRNGIELGEIINKTESELNALSKKAEDYGLILSDTAIKKSKEFTNELDTLGKQFKGLVANLLTNEDLTTEQFDKFITNLENIITKYLPKFLNFMTKITNLLVVGIIKLLPSLVQGIFDTILDLDWLKLGGEITIEIFKGITKTLWNLVQTLFGKGWIWGTDNGIGLQMDNTTEAINRVTTTGVLEKTEKVEEKLEISLNVESDGTVAGEKNLDVISDLVVDKINKMLGDNV